MELVCWMRKRRKIVEKMEGTKFRGSMVLLWKRDPGFVDALDTDTKAAQQRKQRQQPREEEEKGREERELREKARRRSRMT